jgi:hypothetical protein
MKTKFNRDNNQPPNRKGIMKEGNKGLWTASVNVEVMLANADWDLQGARTEGPRVV